LSTMATSVIAQVAMNASLEPFGLPQNLQAAQDLCNDLHPTPSSPHHRS